MAKRTSFLKILVDSQEDVELLRDCIEMLIYLHDKNTSKAQSVEDFDKTVEEVVEETLILLENLADLYTFLK